MSDERLETTIRDSGRLTTTFDDVVVSITANSHRKDDFEAIREAVREVLDE